MDITAMERKLAELYAYKPMLDEMKKGYDEYHASQAERDAREREEDQAQVSAEDKEHKARLVEQEKTDCEALISGLANIGITDHDGNGPFGPLTGKENKQELEDMLAQALALGIKKPEPAALESDDDYRVRVLASANKRDKDDIAKASSEALDVWGASLNLARTGKPSDTDS